MVLVVKIVGSQLISLLDVSDSSADKAEVLPGKTDGVRHAGVVDDGGDREESLNVNILVRVFSKDI